MRRIRIHFTRDYRNHAGLFGFSTPASYANFGEHVDFRYLDFQVRGIGQLSVTWSNR